MKGYFKRLTSNKVHGTSHCSLQKSLQPCLPFHPHKRGISDLHSLRWSIEHKLERYYERRDARDEKRGKLALFSTLTAPG